MGKLIYNLDEIPLNRRDKHYLLVIYEEIILLIDVLSKSNVWYAQLKNLTSVELLNDGI